MVVSYRIRPRPARVAGALLLVLLAAGGVTACQAAPSSPGPVPGQDAAAARPVEVLVSAAASLQDALREAMADFGRDHPAIRVRFNFGSSGALAQQIEAGAPADVFIAAGQQPMDRLVEKGLVDRDAVRVLARNRIVLIVPRGEAGRVRGWQDLTAEEVRRIAIGDPAHVPAGQYGRQVLEHLGLWARVNAKLVLDQDVREVLHHVAAGEAQAGIVYQTDAATSDRVAVVAEAPPGSHRPVVYPMAVLKDSRHPAEAAAVVEFLLSARSQAVLQRHGFLPPR
ncbi:molybdate ABC transporter substrate-binding protein [Thermaerobacter sp. FW80]|uniref:molybdate ABC transporter substrate-binding protein n=1 Tax=Thermaerobacter sp. FW80 TaxID=2546351 RepID=UPI001FA9AEB9|nr:molybdate ABC transporter substrate-binding protein [Thermaerobacter sp. FW80]